MKTLQRLGLILALGLSAATGEEPEFAPLPYTANQIRRTLSEGFRCTYRTVEGELTVQSVWTVVKSDAESASIEYLTLDATGEPIGSPETRDSTWVELRDHAKFPAAQTSVRDASCTVPSGTFECWLYTVRSEREGVSWGRRFYFAKEKPGAPVRFETHKDGTLISRTELTSLERPTR